MTRGELIKKLIASQNKPAEFRSIAMQIIEEEEKKKNFLLAKSLRKSLDLSNEKKEPHTSNGGVALSFIPHERDKKAALIEPVTSQRRRSDLILSRENRRLLSGVVEEFRRGDMIRNHGLKVRSKMLFCGPPGCGKTLCAEVFAKEVGLPLFVVRFDVLVSSYLGETAGNLRRIFDFAGERPAVLFFDEFDAVGRSRNDESEHGELKRVVNALLQLIDRYETNGFVIAATNHEGQLDSALWRRFDEVVFFEKPNIEEIRAVLVLKLKNFPADFEPSSKAKRMIGFSHAEIERVCVNAIKKTILKNGGQLSDATFEREIDVEERRRKVIADLSDLNQKRT